jgi:hypothetical protein
LRIRLFAPALLALAACAPEEGAQAPAAVYANAGCAQVARARVTDATANGIAPSYYRRIFDDTYAGCVGQRSRTIIITPPPPPPPP